MKILARDYNKAQGEPFRVEDYRGKKLEMYYLDDRSDYSKFASKGRFSLWTSNGEDFRLFVDKGYYESVGDLYRNDINEIWLDFTLGIYEKQKEMSKKYMFISFISLFVIMGLALLLPVLFPDLDSTLTFIPMILLFVGLFYTSSRQQKSLKTLVDSENQKASKLIRSALGEESFEKVYAAQERYYNEYFKVDLDDEETEEAEVVEVLDNTDVEELEEIEVKDDKDAK